MTASETGGINATRPYIDMVRQPDDFTCFAACVSTITGIPIDALPLAKEAALDIANFGPDVGFIIVTDEMRNEVAALRGFTSIDDWQRGIDNTFILEPWTYWDQWLGEGILCLATWMPEKVDGHAVVIDEQGFLHDPADGAFEGMHIMKLTRACNVTVTGFIKFIEVEG